jgi:hypothetical protein
MVAPASGLPFRNVPVADAAGKVVGYRPEYVRNAGTIAKTMTPAQIQSAKQAAANAAWKQYNDDRNYGLNVWKANQSAATARDKYNLDREKYEYLKENGLYGKKGGTGKPNKAAQGISNSISSTLNDIDGFISSGDTESARAAMEDMYDMIEKGYKDGTLDEDDKQFFEDIWRGKRFEYYKTTGQDDEAAWEASQMSPDGWAAQYGQKYGKQPYKG